MNGFLSAMGQEFARALRSVAGDEGLCGADVYTVVTRTLPAPLLSPAALASLTQEQREELRSGFARFLEVSDDAVTSDQIATAIARTLARWPVRQGK
jgi:hypothetical protein